MSDFILDEPFYIKRFIYSVNGSVKAGTQSDIPARDYDSFVLIRKGTCSYEFEHKKFKACPGDIVFLAKKSPYKILVGEEKYEFSIAILNSSKTVEQCQKAMFSPRKSQ